MAIERMLKEETPARVLVGRVLQEAGIEYVFGISGGHTGRIVSGLRKYQNSLRMVTVREESLAGVMAEVYGRLTRRPGVMIGQGPWVLGNGMIGTMEAFLSVSPMMLLTDFSDASRFQLHAPYQQATGDYGSWDARRAFGGVTKQVMQAQEPVAAVQATQLAIKHAMAGQPGPVAVLFSHGCAGRHGGPDPRRHCIRPAIICRRRHRRPMPRASPPRPTACWRHASRSMIAGNGVRIAQGYEQLRELAETAGLPVGRQPPARAALPKRTAGAGGVRHVRHQVANAASPRPIWCWRRHRSSGRATPPGKTASCSIRRGRLSSRSTSSRSNASWTFPAEQVVLGDAAHRAAALCDAVRPRATGRQDAAEPALPVAARRRVISTRRNTSRTTSRSCRSGRSAN